VCVCVCVLSRDLKTRRPGSDFVRCTTKELSPKHRTYLMSHTEVVGELRDVTYIGPCIIVIVEE